MFVVCKDCDGTGGENHNCEKCGGIGEIALSYEEMAKSLHYVLGERDELEARLENANRDTDKHKAIAEAFKNAAKRIAKEKQDEIDALMELVCKLSED
jgi:phage-related minor tail protein